MYSKDNEPVCGLCLYSEAAKGLETHVACKKKGGYVNKSRDGCEFYKYDIFKRKVSRKKNAGLEKFSKEDFSL